MRCAAAAYGARTARRGAHNAGSRRVVLCADLRHAVCERPARVTAALRSLKQLIEPIEQAAERLDRERNARGAGALSGAMGSASSRPDQNSKSANPTRNRTTAPSWSPLVQRTPTESASSTASRSVFKDGGHPSNLARAMSGRRRDAPRTPTLNAERDFRGRKVQVDAMLHRRQIAVMRSRRHRACRARTTGSGVPNAGVCAACSARLVPCGSSHRGARACDSADLAGDWRRRVPTVVSLGGHGGRWHRVPGGQHRRKRTASPVARLSARRSNTKRGWVGRRAGAHAARRQAHFTRRNHQPSHTSRVAMDRRGVPG